MRPAVLQKLTSGKILSGKTFPAFVDTWNWLVDFVDNLKGDGDVSTGKIRVDRSNSDNPVIRLNGGVGGNGNVKVTGTDGATVEGSSIIFKSNEDSNVSVIAKLKESDDGDSVEAGTIVCEVGVYYV